MMSKVVEMWQYEKNGMRFSSSGDITGLKKAGDALAAEVERLEQDYKSACDGRLAFMEERNDLRIKVERLEKALRTIAECSDIKEMYRIARGE